MNQKVKSARAEIVGEKVLVHITLEIDPQVIGANLTRREKQILGFVKGGLLNKEIADAINVSESAVKFHISNLLAKSGARSRMELCR